MRVNAISGNWLVGCVAAVVLALTFAPTRAEGPAAASDLALAKSLSRAFQAVARNVEPSVVHITQINTVLVRRSFFDPGEPQRTATGLGSGVIVSPDGYILTNAHVVRAAQQLKVRLLDGQEYDAKVVGRDDLTDIAVIKIEAFSLPTATFGDSDELAVGEWVVAIGSPFGFSSTVTAGIVSAKGRTGIGLPGLPADAYQDFIQTDAAINPGNSGGPLLNLEGQVVGVNSAIASRTGSYEGIGFAIPSNMARPIMQSIIEHGKVIRGYLGVTMSDLTPDQARAMGLRSPAVVVRNVVPGSPADRAGLRRGDVILRAQGRPVEQHARLRTAVSLMAAGSPLELEVLRDRNPVSVVVTVGDSAQISAAARLGVSVETLSRETLRTLGYRNMNIRGVRVVSVVPEGTAARSGVEVNDIITGLDQTPIQNAEQFEEALRGTEFTNRMRLYVIRDGERGYLLLEP